ncbi:MAG: hypothetical protein ABI678_13250, partial [Kofleriaceae bacterium]
MGEASMRSILLVCLTMMVTACGQPNPDACCTTTDDCLKYGFSGITLCAGDRVCSSAGTCVDPACHTTPDCNDPALICDVYGQCVPEGQGSNQSTFKLTVQIAGSGVGTVASSPAGLTCSTGTCTGEFETGTEVTLTQVASGGTFLGWANACRGTDSCTVTMSADRRVGAMFGSRGEVLWGKPLDGSGLEWGHGAAVDGNGDVVAVGQYLGTMNLDSVSLQSDSTSVTSAYVVGLDGISGKAIWGKNYPVESANMIASDGVALYVIGLFTGTVQLGSTTLTSRGLYDVYAMKLNGVGEVQWAMSVGGPGSEFPTGISASNGTVAFVGSEQNGITIGSAVTPDAGAPTGFVAAIDAGTGALKWSRVFVSGGATASTRAVVAGSTVIVGGAAIGTLDFGAGNVAAIGANDAFVARYEPDTGNLAKFDHWGASGSSSAINALSEDSAGHLVATGTFFGSLTIGAQTHTGSGNSPFVASFDGSTNLWYSGWSGTPTGASMIVAPMSISAGASEAAIAGVFCNGSLHISATTLIGTSCTVQNQFRTGFLARLKNNGSTYLSIHSLGPVGWVDAVARATDDRLFVTGKLLTSLSMESGPVLVQSAD